MKECSVPGEELGGQRLCSARSGQRQRQRRQGACLQVAAAERRQEGGAVLEHLGQVGAAELPQRAVGLCPHCRGGDEGQGQTGLHKVKVSP